MRPLDGVASARLLAIAGACLLAAILAQAYLHQSGALGIGDYRRLAWFVAGWFLAGAIYACAVAISTRMRGRDALALVLAIAAALRIAPLLCPPFLSTDVYRYVWDGRVQDAGVNPYCCIPSAPELAPLRDREIYPFVNRSDYAPTIYPPVAQMMFSIVARLSQTVFAMKLAMAAAEATAIAAMIALLRQAGLPLARVLIYAWNPIAVWEYSGNGHVDALAIAGTGLSLLAAARGRTAASGAALAAATLTKFLPVVMFPAIWKGLSSPLRSREAGTAPIGGGWRSLSAKFPIAFAVAVVVAYACYASVGARVFGFLPSYSREEGIDDGGGVYPLQLLGKFFTLPSWAAVAWLGLAALVMAAISVRILLRGKSGVVVPGENALLLSTIAIVAVSPHYAWYFGGLAYLSCLAVWPSVIWLTIGCAALYLDATHVSPGWSTLLYGPFAVLAARDLLRSRAEPRTVGKPACP